MKQRTIYLIRIAIIVYILAALLISVGCKSINNAPVTTLYVIDLDNGICSKRQITDKKTLTSKRVAELPVSECDGIIGLSPEEFLNLRTYMKQGQ